MFTTTPHEKAHNLMARWHFEGPLAENAQKQRVHLQAVSAVFGDADYIVRMDSALNSASRMKDPEYAADLFEAMLIVHRDEGHRFMSCIASICKQKDPHLLFPSLVVGGLRAFFFNKELEDEFATELPKRIGSLVCEYVKLSEKEKGEPSSKIVGQFTGLLGSYLNLHHFEGQEVIRRAQTILRELRAWKDFSGGSEEVYKLYLEVVHKIFAVFTPVEQMDGLLEMMKMKMRYIDTTKKASS